MSALLTFSGLLGGADLVGRVSFLVFLVLFIISAAATALKRNPG
ncbi:MAG: DUF1328 domain-containing protein [Planctomycetes bacterium]|nr:DUF1328 domain-containing protein [Planctomycetota bacterium]